MRLTPDQIESYTPREFTILMRSQQERQYDEYEHMTLNAMMIRQAYHAEKLKPSDLFKRDSASKNRKSDATDKKADMRKQQDWLDGLMSVKPPNEKEGVTK